MSDARLDAIERTMDTAAAAGRKTVILHVRRKSQPKGRTRLAGRSGPRSIGATEYVFGDTYTAWWSIADVRAWVKVQRDRGSSIGPGGQT